MGMQLRLDILLKAACPLALGRALSVCQVLGKTEEEKVISAHFRTPVRKSGSLTPPLP